MQEVLDAILATSILLPDVVTIVVQYITYRPDVERLAEALSQIRCNQVHIKLSPHITFEIGWKNKRTFSNGEWHGMSDNWNEKKFVGYIRRSSFYRELVTFQLHDMLPGSPNDIWNDNSQQHRKVFEAEVQKLINSVL
jgi:hypothetical protein